MSLKSIRESYSKLLTVFNDAGIKFNESQKADLDTFVLALESNMEEQRKAAIRQTKKAVEEKMEKEYRTVFESVMQAMQENAELASKIQDRIARIDEKNAIAGKVNDYLELYVESVLPKKTVIDYDRMRKLERIHESLRDALVVSEDAVEQKVKQLEESYKVKQSNCETQVAKMTVKLNEAMKRTQEYKEKVNHFKAAELLEQKTKYLPSFEARQVKKALSESSAEEIKEKFDKTLKEVRKDIDTAQKKRCEEAEETIKDEVEKILEDDGVEENDMLKDKPHNGHIPADKVQECDDTAETDECDKFETMEEIEYGEDGDVALSESDVIDGDLMKVWCLQSQEMN